MSDDLFRPVIGIEHRAPQEVFGILCDRFRPAIAELDRLRTEAEPVRVKALEWAHGGGLMGKRGWRLVARPPVGSIYVIEVIIHGQRGQRWTLAGDQKDYATADEAKAAAQADYETRIRAALQGGDNE